MTDNKSAATSDEGSKSGTADAETNTNTAADTAKDSDFYKAEAHKAFKARDKAKADADAALARLAALEEKFGARDLDDAKKSGEVEKVNKAWEEKHNKEIADRDARETALKTRFKRAVVERDFQTIAAADAVNMASLLGHMTYEGFSLDSVQQDDGSEQLVVKTPQGIAYTDVKKWLGEFLDTNPHLARSGRRGGTNSTGTKENAGKALDIEAIKKLPADQQREAFNKNPEAAKSLLKGIGGF